MASGIKVADIMSSNVVFATPDMRINEVAKLMNEFRIGGLPVLTDSGLCGIITERDIMKRVIQVDRIPSEVLVKDVMTCPPKVVCSIDDDMEEVAELMVASDVTRIPVVRDDKLVGIITNRDVLKNSTDLMDLLIEQARVKGKDRQGHVSYGKCELCGTTNYLNFKGTAFVCDVCSMR
jgi:CBS domain-containing protein